MPRRDFSIANRHKSEDCSKRRPHQYIPIRLGCFAHGATLTMKERRTVDLARMPPLSDEQSLALEAPIVSDQCSTCEEGIFEGGNAGESGCVECKRTVDARWNLRPSVVVLQESRLCVSQRNEG